jgi:hypothetical protein
MDRRCTKVVACGVRTNISFDKLMSGARQSAAARGRFQIRPKPAARRRQLMPDDTKAPGLSLAEDMPSLPGQFKNVSNFRDPCAVVNGLALGETK